MKEWKGGECPLPPGTPYEARHRDGGRVEGEKPELDIWAWTGKPWDIVAYQERRPNGRQDRGMNMRVKIGSTWYHSDEQAICIELTEENKKKIASMGPDYDKLAEFPDDMEVSREEMTEWMKG